MPTLTIDSQEFEVYSDIGETDNYALGAIHATAWRAADDTTKGMALVTATRTLDRQVWVGEKTDPEQALAWPRSNTGVDGIEDDVVPPQVIQACQEMAIALVAGSTLQDDQNTSQKIQTMKAGSVSLTYFRGAEGRALRFPLIINELLRGLLASGANRLTGVASGVSGTSVTENDFGLNDAL